MEKSPALFQCPYVWGLAYGLGYPDSRKHQLMVDQFRNLIYLDRGKKRAVFITKTVT
jgi:putative transposase